MNKGLVVLIIIIISAIIMLFLPKPVSITGSTIGDYSILKDPLLCTAIDLWGCNVTTTGGNGGADIWTDVNGTATYNGYMNASKDDWGIWSNGSCIVIGNLSEKIWC